MVKFGHFYLATAIDLEPISAILAVWQEVLQKLFAKIFEAQKWPKSREQGWCLEFLIKTRI